MGKILKPKKVKLFSSFLYSISDIFYESLKIITQELNLKADFISWEIPFEHTTYYNNELGNSIKRRIVSFLPLKDIDGLYKVKLYTNSLEQRLANNLGLRCVNIDPGYITSSSLVVFTTKNYANRIYIKDGIYADMHYIVYKSSKFKSFEWTYKDWKEEDLIILASFLRKWYLKQLKDVN